MDKTIKSRLEYGKFVKRRRIERFIFQYNHHPRSKTSMSASETKLFRDALIKSYGAFRSSAWKIPLAVSVFSAVSEKNPPHIHTIPKNYLDLCRGIVYEDDGQIEYLAVDYRIGQSFGPPLTFEFYPMSGLRQDLRLARDIILEAWDDDEDIMEAAGESTRQDLIMDPVEDWLEARRDRSLIEARMGKDLAEAYHRFLQYFAQEHQLERAAIGVWNGYALIVRPPKGKSNDDPWRIALRQSEFEQNKSLAKMELRSKLKMQVLKVPIQGTYSGAQFKQDLRTQIREFRKNSTLFSKLLAPIGLQVLFAPPQRDTGVVRDIDNVMRVVAPLIHDELVPPLSSMHLSEFSKLPPDMRTDFERRLAEYPKGLKCQILNYEIFRVPLDRATEATGQIAIGLCKGVLKRNLMRITRDVIEAWWRKLDD